MPFDYLRMVLIARGKERKLVVEICLFFFFFNDVGTTVWIQEEKIKSWLRT